MIKNITEYAKKRNMILDCLTTKPLSSYSLIYNNLKFRKDWYQGLTTEQIQDKIGKILVRHKKKRVCKGTIYNCISWINRIKELGIFIDNQVNIYEVAGKIKKREHRYFCPYDDFDRQKVRDKLDSKAKIVQLKRNTLDAFEEEIKQEQATQEVKKRAIEKIA